MAADPRYGTVSVNEVGTFVNEVQQEMAAACYLLRLIHWLKVGQKPRSWISRHPGQSSVVHPAFLSTEKLGGEGGALELASVA